MKTKYGHIDLITDYPKNDHVVRQIVEHLREKKMFALYYNDSPEKMAAMIYNPKNLKALHTNGDVFEYPTPENFTDSIRLTLIAYPKFMSCDKMAGLEKQIILIE